MSDYLTLPLPTPTASSAFDPWPDESESISSVIPREVELQSACLDGHALFGLFVAISIWVVCDLFIKFGQVIKQLYRGICKKCPKKYDVEQSACHDSTVSEDYVTGATSIPLRPITSTPRPLRAGIVIMLRKSRG